MKINVSDETEVFDLISNQAEKVISLMGNETNGDVDISEIAKSLTNYSKRILVVLDEVDEFIVKRSLDLGNGKYNLKPSLKNLSQLNDLFSTDLISLMPDEDVLSFLKSDVKGDVLKNVFKVVLQDVLAKGVLNETSNVDIFISTLFPEDDKLSDGDDFQNQIRSVVENFKRKINKNLSNREIKNAIQLYPGTKAFKTAEAYFETIKMSSFSNPVFFSPLNQFPSLVFKEAISEIIYLENREKQSFLSDDEKEYLDSIRGKVEQLNSTLIDNADLVFEDEKGFGRDSKMVGWDVFVNTVYPKNRQNVVSLMINEGIPTSDILKNLPIWSLDLCSTILKNKRLTSGVPEAIEQFLDVKGFEDGTFVDRIYFTELPIAVAILLKSIKDGIFDVKHALVNLIFNMQQIINQEFNDSTKLFVKGYGIQPMVALLKNLILENKIQWTKI